MEIYADGFFAADTGTTLHADCIVAGVNAVHAAARRETLEEVMPFLRAFNDWYTRDGSVGGLADLVRDHQSILLNASPGSGVPDDAEGRGRAPSTAGDPIQRGDPVSKHFPPAPTSANAEGSPTATADSAIRDETLDVEGRASARIHAHPAAAAPPSDAQERYLVSVLRPPFKHLLNCPGATDDGCTCGLTWRIRLATEQQLHAAWRKRAEEAELKVAAPSGPTQEEVGSAKAVAAYQPNDILANAVLRWASQTKGAKHG